MARSDAGQRPEALPVARAGCYCTVANSPAVSPLPTATYRCRCQSLTASSMIYDHVSIRYHWLDIYLGGGQNAKGVVTLSLPERSRLQNPVGKISLPY